MTERQSIDFTNNPVIYNKSHWDGFCAQKSSISGLIWPCVMYQVEIQTGIDGLDIFEKTILKFADCGTTNTAEVSELLNLKNETVTFIQDRLVAKALLEDGIYHITEKGKSVLDQYLTIEPDKTEVVCLFKNLLTGEFIDLVEKNPSRNTLHIIESKKGVFTLPGNERKDGYLVLPDDDEYETIYKADPKPYELLRTIKKYNANAPRAQRIPLNKKSNTINVKAKDYVFVYTTVFTTIFLDIYCTDAAGFGVSDIFTDFIRNADEHKYPWIKEIIDKGKTNIEENSPEEKEKIPFAFSKVSKLIFDAKKDLKKLEDLDKNTSNDREVKNLAEKIYYNCFTAFEYALQMYYEDYNSPVEEDFKIKQSDINTRKDYKSAIEEMGNIENNILLFLELSDNLSFNPPENAWSLLKVYPGKIKAMRNEEEPELVPLLCLSLAYANIDFAAPLCKLAADEPNFIKDIYNLKAIRDKTSMAHGLGLESKDVSSKNCAECIDLVIYYISYLNTKIKEDFKRMEDFFKEEHKNLKYSTFIEKRYEKRIELYKAFGNSRINNLSKSLREQLIDCFMTFKERTFVAGTACAVLQQFFEYAIQCILENTSVPDKNSRTAIIADQKCIEAGFSLRKGHLSNVLQTVNYKRLNKAICGGGCETLGAGILAFILMIPVGELQDIAKRHPDFILHLEDMIDSRGHSDVKEYSEEEVSTYKENITYIVKELIYYIY